MKLDLMKAILEILKIENSPLICSVHARKRRNTACDMLLNILNYSAICAMKASKTQKN